MLGIYAHKNSFVHKLSFGYKLLFLLAISIFLFSFSNIYVSITIFGLSIFLFFLAKFNTLHIYQQIKPLVWFFLVFFVIDFISNGIISATNMIARLMSIVLLSALINLTTKPSQIIDSFEVYFSFFHFFNINPKKISLTISLVLRFIPIVIQIFNQVKDVQQIRGGKNTIMIVILTIVNTFKMAENIALSLELREHFFDD